MKLSKRQTYDILRVRRALLKNSFPKLKWKEYISLYYYAKCKQYDEAHYYFIDNNVFYNWKNHVELNPSKDNPYKSRYYEIFSPKSKE